MTKHDRSLPWEQFMEIAFGILHLPSDGFWQMTPCEWIAALRGWNAMHGEIPTAPICREELSALIERFPDTPT